MLSSVAAETVADAYLDVLDARGVEYFFGNAGTDFLPAMRRWGR